MPQDSVNVLLDFDVPMTLIETLVRQHLLASLTRNGNGHQNGHAPVSAHGAGPTVPVQEEPETPVLPSSTVVP